MLTCSRQQVNIRLSNTYFQNQPKKINFDGECPITLDFSDYNNKFLLSGTSQRNHYTIDSNDLKIKNIDNETEKMEPLETSNTHIAFGLGFKYIIAVDDSEAIFFLKHFILFVYTES